MKILFLDFETTCADPKTARPWEFGVLSTDEHWNAKRQAVHRVWSPDYPDLSEGARRACKIEQLRLDQDAMHPRLMYEILVDFWIKDHDYVCAYNAQFDKTILEEEAKRHAISLPAINWICGLNDVPYPIHYRCRQLSHLALDHGIMVDPKTTHGALADVLLIRDLFDVGGYSLDGILSYKNDPWIFIKAELPKPWGPGAEAAKLMQEEAKADGYGWQTAKGTSEPVFEKTWVKRVKLADFEQEKTKKLSFKRSKLEN